MQQYIHTLHTYVTKGKLSHNKSWSLEGGGMNVWVILTLTFGTTRTSQLSATRAGRTLPLMKFLGIHFFYRLSGPQSYWKWIEGIDQFKTSNDPTGHRNRNLCLLTQCINNLRHRLSFVTNNKTIYVSTFRVKHNSPTINKHHIATQLSLYLIIVVIN